MPIIKHMPGHGRATSDSHRELPRVSAPRELLEQADFLPFRLLSDLPWGMTAHLLFESVDREAPVTISARAVKDVIRGYIGFDGMLVSDDLSMQALGGSLGERAERALAAGCDLALHCNGRMDEMQDIVRRTGAMTDAAWRRFENGRNALRRLHAPLSKSGFAEAAARFRALVPEQG
jgi:beta-N-acetylhexosaminidase